MKVPEGTSDTKAPRKRVARFGVRGAIAVAVAALGCAVVLAWGPLAPHPEGGSVQGVALPAAESLADEQSAAVASVASHYQPESLQKFEPVLRIRNGSDEQVALPDVPAADYSGFMFEVADAAAGAGDVSAKMAEAVQAGTVRPVRGNVYAVDSLDVLASLLEADQVAYVEPNYTMHLIGEVDEAFAGEGTMVAQARGSDAGGTSTNPAPAYPPNDQNYSAGKLWHLDMLNVKEAWDLGLDGDPFVYNGKLLRETPVKVAVIDTGMYGTGSAEPQHEDFDYDQVEVGYDFIHDSGATAPDAKGHGTFVAGLIAAQVNNQVGVAGLQPGVTIVAEKVFDTSSASTEDVIAAIYHAVDEAHVDVINMSLGGEYNDYTLEVACDYAVSQGVLVVASAGNDGVSTPNYPAAYDSVVGVASVNSSEIRSTWSQYGKSVFVTAAGESVTSTYIEGADSYATASGTSFSGPEVAALAAMCKSVYPDITQEVFKQFLIDTSRDLGEKGYDDFYGYGLVDFGAMAQTVLASQVLPWYHIEFNVVDEDGNPVPGANVTLAAAEDIQWDADSEADPSFEAGSAAKGQQIVATQPGVYDIHRGNYAYTVVADGFYTVEGELKTYASTQQATVVLPVAYEASITVSASDGSALGSAQVRVVSSAGRTEQPKQASGNTSTYDLCSGTYSFEASCAGYEDLAGSFTVQRASKNVAVTLYRADELASVSFDVYDGDAGVKLEANVGVAVYDASGVAVAAQPDGTFRLAKGASYDVVASKVGYDDCRETHLIASDDVQTIRMNLAPATAVITFNVVDEAGKAIASAKADVANASGQRVDPRPGNPLRFTLQRGNYTYRIQAAGYQTVEGSLEVSSQSNTLTITLEALPSKVSFAVTDVATGVAIADANVKVSTDKTLRSLPAQADGTWLLPPGGYRYTVYKEGYEVASGAFTVAGEDLTVSVALTVRAATAEGYAGGSGTQDDPYLIANEDQLRYLASQTEIVRMTNTTAPTNKKESIGGYYQLVDDIELYGEWTPIGNFENTSNYVAFSGTFDGNGHTVSGISIDQPTWDAQGFFGYVEGATIKNLVVQGRVTGSQYVGGLVGRAHFTEDLYYPAYNTEPTYILQCGSEVKVTGRFAVAGIVGSAQATDSVAASYLSPGGGYGITVEECYNAGNVYALHEGKFDRNASAAGGIVGSGQNTVVSHCYNSGNIEAGYNDGGLVGRCSVVNVSNSYNSGRVVQHATGTGYGGTSGGLVGYVYNSLVSDSAYLTRDDNTKNSYFGSTDSASKYVNCAGREYADMYRTDSFVSFINTDTVEGSVGEAFVLGNDFPLLRWQVVEGQRLAPTPRIVEQPQGTSEAEAYKQGESAQALTARVDEPAEGDVTWQWYVSDSEDGSDAEAVVGAAGAGLAASYVPPTDAVSVKYYFVVFTNAVGVDLDENRAHATSEVASVHVRSAVDAQAPAIVKLNPSGSLSYNVNLSAKNGTDLEMSVEAQVEDGGELSYQWYRSSSGTGTGAAVSGATDSTFDVDTSVLGTLYYYVEVTNTTQPGNSTTTTSDWITVRVLPYTIDNYQDLVEFRTAVNGGISFAGIEVELTADIDIPDGVDWTPIGTQAHPFAGVFHGGKGDSNSEHSVVTTHKITNVNIDGDRHGNRYLGLFGVTYNASIYGLQVQGRITGAANTYAGLLVGSAQVTSLTYVGTIENCATLPGSSVEGKYLVAGLAGNGSSAFVNCANHADVHAVAYVPDSADTSVTTSGLKAVGGVVAYDGAYHLSGCYNDGTITADDKDGDAISAEYVGGVVGFTNAYSGIVSSYNAGKIEVAQVAENHITQKGIVQYAGSVAGYVAYDNALNIHFVENTYDCGVVTSNGYTSDDLADLHSVQFMKTQYFADMLNTVARAYTSAAFTARNDGQPRFFWEDDLTVADPSHVQSAEPDIIDLVSPDFPDIKTTGLVSYYQGEAANPLYVVAKSPDGGTLTYVWQKRAVGAGDDAWQDVPGSQGTVATEGEDAGKAFYTFDTSEVGEAEYRCYITNRRADATAEPLEESAYIPAIRLTVESAEGMFKLKDPSQPNAEDNPYIIATAEQLRAFGDVVNGTRALASVTDRSFAGKYVQLAADIDLSGYASWTPIARNATGASSFSGIFDGAGYKVTGLTIAPTGSYQDDYAYQGLFGRLSGATLKNLEVQGSVDVPTSAAWITGGVVAYAYRSYIDNVVSRVDVVGYEKVGGVVAYAGQSKISNCENLGAVSMNDASKAYRYSSIQFGGVVGYYFTTAEAVANGAGIFDCFNAGPVAGKSGEDSEYYFGAVVGASDTAGVVHHCYYLEGSVTDASGNGKTPTGVGRKGDPVADAPGACMPVESVDSPQTAWALATSDGTADNSGLWGNYARTDLGDESAHVHLIRDAAAKPVYHVDAASVAADIKVSAEYAMEGQGVQVTWEYKPGFTVKSVGWASVGSDEVHLLGEGDVLEQAATFAMPASDVVFVVDYEQDLRHRYLLSSKALYGAQDAPADAVVVTLQPESKPTDGKVNALAGETISVTLQVSAAYQVVSATAVGAFGTPVSLERIDSLHYEFVMPAENVTVTVVVTDAGAAADDYAATLPVDASATHVGAADDVYRASNLIYQTLAVSGSYVGSEDYYHAADLETQTVIPLYQQQYSLTGEGLHEFTGLNLASVIVASGTTGEPPADDAPVLVETTDGAVYSFTYGDVSALTYNAYDAAGQPVVRGLPVLLFFGRDGQPNTEGAMGIVFGESSAHAGLAGMETAGLSDSGMPADGSSLVIEDVARIVVGDDVDFSQHVWGVYTDMDAISGGKANDLYGYTDLTVRVYRGVGSKKELVTERVLSLEQIEAMARADRAGIQRGEYTTMLYEDRTSPTSGPYTDYYEGYDLYKVLQAAGVSYAEGGWVQFYQSGMYGLDRSWETVLVSLDYVAGNGPEGVGDYSNNTMTYQDNAAESNYAPGTGTLTGLHPLLVYGKNGLPLVWSSGSTGVNSYAYNYRGPMMAFLPQNKVEGGSYVGSDTATTCYLALIDVYMPEDWEPAADDPSDDPADDPADQPGGTSDGGDDKPGTGGSGTKPSDEGQTGGSATGDSGKPSQGGAGAAGEGGQGASVPGGSGASGGAGGASSESPASGPATWQRLWGNVALDTMRAIIGSDTGFAQADTVVVATNGGYWDALSASALAGKVGGPVLLTDPNSLSPQTAAEIQRLGASKVYIAGGPAAVSVDVDAQIEALGCSVKRVYGQNAADTAVQIAYEVGAARSDTCIIATSFTFQDALSASPYAYATKSPIYLTDAQGVLAQSTLDAIVAGGYSRAIITGGTAAVDPATEAKLTAAGIVDIQRLWGQTAYETSGALAAWGIAQGMSADCIGVATATGYWDALCGAALCGKNNAVLILADDVNLVNVSGILKANAAAVTRGYAFGGTAALGATTYQACVNATQR